MELNNQTILQIVIEKDWLANKDIRQIYGDCAPSTATKRLNEIRAFAEAREKDSTKRYIHRHIPTDIFLSYIGKSLDDLIRYEKKKQTIESLLQDRQKEKS